VLSYDLSGCVSGCRNTADKQQQDSEVHDEIADKASECHLLCPPKGLLPAGYAKNASPAVEIGDAS
jgi:hypothetical protein